MWEDLRYGFRLLRKAPGWTIVMSATLALGVGLTTAIFSIADSILLRSLPYPDSQRLSVLWTTSSAAAAANVTKFAVSSADWLDWRAQSKLFEDIAVTRVANLSLTGDGEPERVIGAKTSSNLLNVLGVRPILGRMITEEETQRDAKVAILSYGFWNRRYGRDRSVIGRSILLNDQPFQVIGVLPPDLGYPSKNLDLLTPLFVPQQEIRSRFAFFYRAVGRLKPGVSLAQAQSEMSAVMLRLAQQYPATNGAQKLGVLLEPLLDSTVGPFRTVLDVLLGAVACLLLIAVINLGGLMIARATARNRETAVRAALGASTNRLRIQILAEVIPLSLIGCCCGVLLSWALLKVLTPLLPQQLPGTASIGLHAPVLFLALLLSVAAVMIAGMLPARMASRVQIAGSLQQDSRTVAGGGGARSALVAAQIAVTLVLVFAGGLLIRSLVAVMRVNPGFSTKGVLTMKLAVTRAKYPTDLQVSDYYRRLIERLKTTPGILNAGFINILPLGEGKQVNPVEFEGKLDRGWVGADTRSVTSGYFSSMGMRLIKGRDFSEADNDHAPRVGIIDEQLSGKVFGQADPLGKRCRFATGATTMSPWIEIVGVVGHIRNDNLETDPRPQIYWPEAQVTQDRGALVIRTAGKPEAYASALIAQIHKVNPDQPLYDVLPMADWLEQSLRSRKLLAGLITVFGGSSLLLACLGLYGVISYFVGLRVREFAIRMALGAPPRNVRWLVLAQALRLWILGTIIGLAAAWPAGRLLRGLLYGVGSVDGVSLALAPFLLLLTALLAGLVPLRRAARVNPALALRAS
ncbi:MAG TPA: ABC transporter permease [Bryobacteraceae bacterium]|nr:ABC transporter permease [Bryobacteraceae bacterium]